MLQIQSENQGKMHRVRDWEVRVALTNKACGQQANEQTVSARGSQRQLAQNAFGTAVKTVVKYKTFDLKSKSLFQQIHMVVM